MKRSDFLNNIRHSLKTAHLPASLPERPAAPPLPAFNPADLVDDFIAEATALSAEVHRTENKPEALNLIAHLLDKYRVNEYLSWDAEFMPIPELQQFLTHQNKLRDTVHLPVEQAPREAALARLGEIQVSITGSLGGLADTGSIAVENGRGRSRLASLLPPVHLALVKTSQLYPSMAHFLAAHPGLTGRTSNLVFITGPSRTADIEQTLTLGVHGPKELHLILLAD
jgi:L-lactate dehydrogenase complex protein LldG